MPNCNITPKISIVTPSYNQGHFIEDTIRSVLVQNYPNLEYVIIDGGSTDETLNIIEKYSDSLHYWCSERDYGQYDAINKGFASTTGEIMAWINSDDMFCPWAFKTAASIMSEIPEVQWLTTLAPGYWEASGFCLGFGSAHGFARQAFLDGLYMSPPNDQSFGFIQQESTFWTRSLWEKVGGHINTYFELAGDFDLWSRFFLHADLYGVDSPLGGFRFQSDQRSRQMDKYLAEAVNSLEIMRRKMGWSSSVLSEAEEFHLRNYKQRENTDFNRFNNSYLGKRIVRENFNSLKGFWRVDDYRFP